MRKKLPLFVITLLLCLCHTAVVWAGAQPGYSLVVYTTDGVRTSFAFADSPVMTIEGTVFHVRSAMADAEYAANDIVRFTLEEVGSVAGGIYWLVVHTHDGLADGYAFSDCPEVRIRGGLFYVTAAGRTLAYPAASIDRFTIDDHYAGDATPHGGVVTAVEAAGAVPARPDNGEDARPQLRLTPGSVSLSGLRAGSAVHVYDSGGRLSLSAVAGADGSMRLSLDALRPGVYVVSTGQSSFKVVRK